MNYKEYQKSRDLAWEILLREKVRALPVDVLQICKRLGIRVVQLREPRAEAGDGYSCIIEGVPYICIASDAPHARRRFTVAHELGHILLGHVGKHRLVNREPSPDDDPIEQAANVFAARLLAPACVLWGCKATSAEEIATLCDISPTAAKIRAERMKILLERGRFCTSALERRVYRRFRKYIKEHQKR